MRLRSCGTGSLGLRWKRKPRRPGAGRLSARGPT